MGRVGVDVDGSREHARLSGAATARVVAVAVHDATRGGAADQVTGVTGRRRQRAAALRRSARSALARPLQLRASAAPAPASRRGLRGGGEWRRVVSAGVGAILGERVVCQKLLLRFVKTFLSFF